MSDSRAILARLPTAVPRDMAVRLDAAEWEPVRPRTAASVVLMREGVDGLESFLLHRHARMPFAAGMVVFPGGCAEPADGGPVGCGIRETREETGVSLEAEALRPWAHWITPEFEPRRYDTHFFVAMTPAGQEARDISGETDRAGWSTPARALAAAERGDVTLMPPTASILMELADLRTTSAVLAAARDRLIRTVLPRAVQANGHWRFDYGPVADGRP